MRAHHARWPMFRRVALTADLLERMIARTGADGLLAARMGAGVAVLEARAVCIRCPNSGSCRDWLHTAADHPEASVIAEPPAFCLNAPLLRACRTEPPSILE